MKRIRKTSLAPSDYLTDADMRRVREYLEKQGHYRTAETNLFIVDLMLGSGLRVGCEVCRLRIRDTPYYHKRPSLFVRQGKGSKSRNVAIGDDLVNTIEQYILKWRKDAAPDDALIEGNAGKARGYKSIWRMVHRIAEKLKIDFHPHSLRHTALTHMKLATNDLLFVQAQAGHESLATTQIYMHVEVDEETRQKLNGKMCGQKKG